MKNITLSADEDLIAGARRRARAENTTLNNLFREWLASYASRCSLSLDEIGQAAQKVEHFRRDNASRGMSGTSGRSFINFNR